MHIFPRVVTPLLLTLCLSSCALFENQYKGSAPQLPDADVPAGSESPPKGVARSASELAEMQAQERDRVDPVMYRGTDRQFNPPKKAEQAKLIGDAVSLNFEEAPLGEVLHAVMGDILGLDYIVDHPVQGKVTLRSRTPIPRDQLLQVLESLLKANNVLMVRDSQGRYIVTGSQQATRLSPELSSAGNRGTGFSTIVVPLRYISAANMAEILAPVAEESAFLRVDNVRNLLMLAGTQTQLSGWLDMVNTFDVDMLKGMSVGLFPLEHSGVEETAEVLNGMLNSGGEKGDFAQLVKIIPIKRLNSLMVVTPRAHYLDTVDQWIKRLDAAPDDNFAKRLYVYPVQNTTATRLADLLQSIYTGASSSGGSGGSGGSASSFGQGGVAPGMSTESIGGEGLSGPDAFSNTGPGSSGGSTGGVAAVVDSGNPEIDDVRVVADDENNALMIYSTGKQFDIIADALQRLDVVATQVIIEASILEVQLTDELQYGLEWTFNGGVGDGYTGVGQLAGNAGVGPAIANGFSYAISDSLGDIRAVLNALAKDQLVNVISTPSVMVLDNHEAYIHVGDQVPVRQGSFVQEGGTVTENFQYRDTGVKLTVKPSVNAGRLVTMDVEQSVTDVGAPDDATGQTTFLERNIKSRVAVRSDEAVVLGGLIRENSSETDSGVPFLHRLPVVGALFGTTNSSSRRTELIVIITPRVISSESELRDVSRELRSRVRALELIRGPAQPEE
ncbi:type II secretion system secretin GspD [Parahaliea aestuarii]|uniref:Type II secretion system protein GspD n=1 Tax=Parahaliea aestuarii TaxID=1852021 RepID=A0A5C8ZRE1_9GAMM|nr:type II secretion system secretin GspD [Parahaliea aestuarii]TXS90067.1 type II secretion system protein GspD [Parahaliea aestuarii]